MQFDRLKRREFITLVGGAAAWPLAARAQQPMPVIGFLDQRSPDTSAESLRAFRQGLKETGHAERENVGIEYRWADNQMDRLSELAAELVRRQVAVIAASGGPPAVLAAKAATASIPVVFGIGQDPVRLGLVASLARPGGNLTGVSFFNTELTGKRLAFLREMVPGAARVAVLFNPASAANAETMLRDVDAAADALGVQIRVFNASTSREIDAVFKALVRERPDALFVGSDSFFTSRRVQLVNLTARHALPASFALREFADVGGLMTYGTNLADVFRQIGVYTGRILKGARPMDLPVMQSTKFELVINAQTARLLDISVPSSLLATADEVIE
jgi:putative tryptophan/tyrosine transport system substrate-binding protein